MAFISQNVNIVSVLYKIIAQKDLIFQVVLSMYFILLTSLTRKITIFIKKNTPKWFTSEEIPS